jgi:hypothetical protein
MAEDPPKAGDVQLQDVAQMLPAGEDGNVEKPSLFDLSFTGALTFSVAEGRLSIALEINTTNGPDTRREASVPVAYFGNSAVLGAFLQDFKRNYFKVLRPALEDEAFLLINDVRGALCGMRGLEGIDRAALIKWHQEKTAQRLEAFLEGMPTPKPAGAWTKFQLDNIVRGVALNLYRAGKRGRALNLQAVNAQLRAEFGDAAPASGEALRKQLDNRKLQWRDIKKEITRAAESVTALLENGAGR